jgi:hypothetical protein
MKLNDLLLTEGLSSVLYHVTTFRSALSILNSNSLRSKAGAISFTRSLTGSYHFHNRIIGVIFEFDGNKLAQSYKGTPVGTEDEDLSGTISYRGRDNKQLEDRVLTKEIHNVSSYIKKAIIFIPTDYIEYDSYDELDSEYEPNLLVLNKVMDALEQKSIPYRVVTDEKQLFSRKDYRNKLNSLIQNYFNDKREHLDSDYAKKFGIDKRPKFEVYVYRGFEEDEYMHDFGVGPEEIDYSDFSYYIGKPTVINIHADDLNHAEELVRKKLTKKFKEKAKDMIVFADPVD